LWETNSNVTSTTNSTTSTRTRALLDNSENNTAATVPPYFIPGGNITCKMDISILIFYHVLKGAFGLEEGAAFLTANKMYESLSIDAQRTIDSVLYHIGSEPGLQKLTLNMLELFQNAIDDLGMVFMIEQIASVHEKFAPIVVEIMEFNFQVDGYPEEGMHKLAFYLNSISSLVDDLVQSSLSCFQYEMQCKDNHDYYYFDETTFCLRTCSLIRRLETSYRQKLCQVQEVMDNCPSVCGVCCEDDASFEIMVNHNSSKYYRGCSWLTEDPVLTKTRQETHCEVIIGDYGKSVRHYCPYSCDACPEPLPNCDDGNLCTYDSIDFESDVVQCKHEPVMCEEGKICDSFTGLCEEIEQIVPCIAVIDEWDDRNYDTEWNLFRQSYPLRPFCLLVPGRPPIDRLPVGFYNDTLSPDNIDRTIALEVNRDGGNSTLISNWLTLCELDKLSNNSIGFVGLFVDTSGSMTLSTVQASYDKFINVDSKAAGLKIVSVFNGNENWIYPFRSELVP